LATGAGGGGAPWLEPFEVKTDAGAGGVFTGDDGGDAGGVDADTGACTTTAPWSEPFEVKTGAGDLLLAFFALLFALLDNPVVGDGDATVVVGVFTGVFTLTGDGAGAGADIGAGGGVFPLFGVFLF